MLLNELFSRLGLETDAASFAKGALAARGVEFALNKVAQAAAFVTETLKDATLGMFAQADGLDDMAAKTGVSVAALQELGYAGQFADVGIESIAQSLRILQRNVTGAVDGNKELAGAFKTLKVPLTDAEGRLRSTEDVFTDLADRFASMPDTAAKTTFAMKVFGKSGAELLPILNNGADGIAAIRAEFRALGGGFSEDFVKGSAEFEDNVLRIKTAWQGVKLQIAQAVLPAFQELAGSTLAWVRANQDLIKTRIGEYIRDAVATVRYWITSIREWVKEQGGLDAVLEKAGKVLKVFVAFLAVREALSFAKGIYDVVTGIKALSVAVAANPIGLFLTAIAILTTSIITEWEEWRYLGVEIQNMFESIGVAIRDFLDGFFDRMADVGLAVFHFLVDPFVWAAGLIKDAFSAVIDWIAEKIEWVAGKITGAVDAVKNAANTLNPFDVNDTSSSGVRGTGVPILDNASALGTPVAVSRDLVGRGGGTVVTMTSAPRINVTQLPGERDPDFAKRVADEVDKRNRTLMREAAGGVQ